VAAPFQQNANAATQTNIDGKEAAMSFEENPESFLWTCDVCGLVADLPPHDFWRALSELKARRWQITRTEDGWQHLCSRCRGKKSATNIAGFLDRKPRASRG
jgi:Fe2+ or Zn2+ uptake regulation protein